MTAVYHITHVDNLPSIIHRGGLVCDRNAQEACIVHIGHRHIKERRMNRAVPLPPFGAVGDYVPFYFAPRSPMLYAIHHGFVEGYEGGQMGVIHLVASVEAVAQCRLRWVFTDGHADMVPLTSFYNDLADLNNIDWSVMNSRYWFDTNEDPDRKRRRQAEFLVHEFFPWDQVSLIGVHDDAVATQVHAVIDGFADQPSVEEKSSWYC